MIPFVNVHSLNRPNVIQLTIKCHFDYEYDILNVTQNMASGKMISLVHHLNNV